MAYRLSSIKTAGTVVYLDGGKIAGTGTFLEIQNKRPGFAKVSPDMRI